MRRLMLFLSLWSATLLLSACASKPVIMADVTSFDFGDVVNGEIISRDVMIHNKGNGTLRVESVSTSCGCTTANLDSMVLEPGQSATLHITFDSGAHGPELTGALTRQIFVVSNDPSQPELLIEFTANVLLPESTP
jgi:hypothetical protein